MSSNTQIQWKKCFHDEQFSLVKKDCVKKSPVELAFLGAHSVIMLQCLVCISAGQGA